VSEPLVIVGNGMAAARLDELTRCALGRHAIAVIGDEPRLAYNSVLLLSVLAGETATGGY
jgi:nitrite reductase (NADH) large subunit